MDDEPMAATDSTGTVVVIGLGEMGHAIALNLCDRGSAIIGCDPSRQAKSRVEKWFPVCSEISEVSRVSAAILSLPGASEVEAVIGRLLKETSCSLVIDTTTSHPQTSRMLAEMMRGENRAFVDAPVSGGKTLAREGLVTSFVGGFPEDVAEAAPLLDAMTGGKWRHMGGPGAGNITKLMNNIMVASHLLVTAEAFSIGLEYGLDPQDITEAIGSASGRSAITEVNLPRWILNDSFNSAFAYSLMARDAQLATAVASELGLEVRMLTETSDRWKELAKRLKPEDDFNRAVPAFIEETGCESPILYPNR